MMPNDALPDTDTGDALRSLINNGSDLSKPIEIDFFIAVPDENAGLEIAREADKIGYNVSLEKDNETGRWTCYCKRKLIAYYSEVVRMEEELDTLAKVHGGYADGFGSYGNAV